MEVLKTLAAAGLAALVGGCEFVREPTAIDLDEEPVVVHAVLASGSNRASVFLVRVTDEGWDSGRSYEYEPGMESVSGAEVKIVSGSDTLRLTERMEGLPTCWDPHRSPYGEESPRPAGGGCYGAVVPSGIRAGTEYSLMIELPDGRVIRGVATPPPAVRVVEPMAHARIAVRREQRNASPLAEIGVRFEAEGGAAAVGLTLRPVAVFSGGAAVAGAFCGIEAPSEPRPARSGSVALPIYGLYCIKGEANARESLQPDSVHARLLVTAYDSAFARYRAALSGKQIRPDAAAQGITGALGLFAGETGTSRMVTLVPVD